MRICILERLVVLVFAVVVLVQPALVRADSQTVFAGVPSIKIIESGLERVATPVSKSESSNLRCVISEIEGKYYWASRDNKEMVPNDPGGAYITFVAADGSGYVRVIKPAFKKAAGLISKAEITFDYVEHMLTGLSSVTYYGVVHDSR